MRKQVYIVFAILALGISFALPVSSKSEPAGNSEMQTQFDEAVRLEENLYRIGRVTVDTEQREATVRGWINMNTGVIEYLACSAGGKLHESLLVLDVKPIHLQVALILLGLESESSLERQSELNPPKGDPVEIWVQWEEGKESKRVRAEKMVLDHRKKGPMQNIQWIYTGSVVYQGRFIAEIERSLIATYHDPAAIINNPLPEGADDTVYGVNSELVPEKGKSIVLAIKAVGEPRLSSKPLPGISADLGRSMDSETKVLFQESFSRSELDMSRWKLTREGDFNQFAVDVQPVVDKDRNDGRLRLMSNTLDTSNPIKYLGVRSMKRVALAQLRELSFDLDWNNQQNGCYLAAALYICPLESENPKKEKEWVKFEWTGVPPGKNIRTNVWANVNGALEQLYTDWGPRDGNGRPQGRVVSPGDHRIKLLFDDRGIRVWADSKQLCYVEYSANFDSGYLYLQMSSGTNYPAREVYFDNITVISSELQ